MDIPDLLVETMVSRTRIEQEVRGRFHEFYAEAIAGLAGFPMRAEHRDFAARLTASERIQQEIARRISEEERAFRERLERLVGVGS